MPSDVASIRKPIGHPEHEAMVNIECALTKLFHDWANNLVMYLQMNLVRLQPATVGMNVRFEISKDTMKAKREELLSGTVQGPLF